MRILVLVALTSIAASAFQLPKGVPEKLSAKYTPTKANTFKCLDGSATIPYKAINDDYCDCKDGSDEPGTSACPNGKFHCRNEGHEPSDIPSSRVNDGICDIEFCCDGSDEFNSSTVSCENVCSEVAQLVNEERQQAQKDSLEGLKLKQEYLVRKAAEDSERAGKIEGLLKEVEVLRRQVDAAKEAADELEKKEEEVKKLYEPSSTVTEAAVETETESYTTTADVTETTPTPVAEPIPDPPELIAARDAHNNARTEYNSLNYDLSNKQTELDGLQSRQNLDLGFDGGLGMLADNCLEYDTPEYIYKLCFFKDAIQKSKNSQSDTSLGTWSKWTGQDLTQFSGKDLKYTEAEFTNGVQCWNGPQRSVKVTLECGSKNEILSFTEPNKCEYAARVVTPGLCESDEDVANHHARSGGGSGGAHESGSHGHGGHGGHGHDEL
ncbi:glucosidase II beta subunit-like-domain-containing protein [Obelidium mucronatum]|nr:glucosidase II beta subunit-like-domain-containing protein [Obelidium mucronatum]